MSLSTSDRESLSKQISDNFFLNFDLSRLNTLHCFLPIQKFQEVDTMHIFERIWQDFPFIQTFVPRINFEKNLIENVEFKRSSLLKKNKWDILEPENGKKIQTYNIDLVITPLLCFDKTGHRVGYGKGFYDNFLKDCKKDCIKVGISFFGPIEKILDVNEDDIKMDYCITPEKVFKFT